jgi:hypothetical protein
MRVEIKLCNGTYWLLISRDIEVLTFIPHARLIEAYETACLLKVHIDNQIELPLGQYRRTA